MCGFTQDFEGEGSFLIEVDCLQKRVVCGVNYGGTESFTDVKEVINGPTEGYRVYRGF